MNSEMRDLFIVKTEGGINLNQSLDNLEDFLIWVAMEESQGNKAKASRYLGINRTTLIEKLKKKNLMSVWRKS